MKDGVPVIIAHFGDFRESVNSEDKAGSGFLREIVQFEVYITVGVGTSR